MLILPLGVLSLSQSSLQLQSEDSASTRASQNNFKGSFTVVNSTCGGIATLNSTQSSTGEFSVLAVGAGSCAFTIQGATGSRATVNVTVTKRPEPTPMPGAPPKKK
jgi:hypothetical protein